MYWIELWAKIEIISAAIGGVLGLIFIIYLIVKK